MPITDGLSLAREIRAQQLEYDYHMLLLSSLFAENLTEDEVKLFDAILNKPLKKRNLLESMLACAKVEHRASAPQVPRAAHNRLTGVRLLLAEDNLVNQRVAIAILNKEGARVTIAGNGLEALDHWQETDFDLILMDLHMPEMDGIAATHAIRSDSTERGRIPILAVTASAMAEDESLCLEAGMDGYLSKPFKADVLVHAILDQLAVATEE